MVKKKKTPLPAVDNPPLSPVCEQCPWRRPNQGKKHPFLFYTRKNLLRLWNQIRQGGSAQSCHLTDPSHEDHVAAGCPEGAKTRECPGSVIVVLREISKMANADHVIDDESAEAYFARRQKKGLSKAGVLYWLFTRYKLGGVPVIGGPCLPRVDIDHPDVGLPAFLED